MSRYTAISIAALLAVLAVAAGATLLLANTLSVARSIESRTKALATEGSTIDVETGSLGELKKVNDIVKEMLTSVTPLAEDLKQIDEQTLSMAQIASDTEQTAAAIESATAGINQTTSGVLTTTGTINSKAKSIDSTTGQMESIATEDREHRQEDRLAGAQDQQVRGRPDLRRQPAELPRQRRGRRRGRARQAKGEEEVMAANDTRDRWLIIWIVVGVAVLAVTGYFLMSMLTSLRAMDASLAAASKSTAQAGTNVKPLTVDLTDVRQTLEQLNAALKPAPGRDPAGERLPQPDRDLAHQRRSRAQHHLGLAFGHGFDPLPERLLAGERRRDARIDLQHAR